MIIKLLLIGLFSILPGQQAGEIDFNPRLLQKEVSSFFTDKNFRRVEVKMPDIRVNGKLFEYKDDAGVIILAYVGRVNSCRAGGCSNPSIAGNDLQFEYFDYFMILDKAKKVKVVRVFNYEATHGEEITIRRWLDQFAGYDGNRPLRAGKEIDTISGATISVNAIVADIQEKTILISKSLL